MRTIDLREKNDEALRQLLDEQRRHLFDLRAQAVTEKLEDTSQFGKTRKVIAQVSSILRERELQAKKDA